MTNQEQWNCYERLGVPKSFYGESQCQKLYPNLDASNSLSFLQCIIDNGVKHNFK